MTKQTTSSLVLNTDTTTTSGRTKNNEDRFMMVPHAFLWDLYLEGAIVCESSTGLAALEEYRVATLACMSGNPMTAAAASLQQAGTGDEDEGRDALSGPQRSDMEQWFAAYHALEQQVTRSAFEQPLQQQTSASCPPCPSVLPLRFRFDEAMRLMLESADGTGNGVVPPPPSATPSRHLHAVSSRLFVGSMGAAADSTLLQNLGITHIVSCVDVSPPFPNQFTYLKVAAQDRPDFDISPLFDLVYDFIEEAFGRSTRLPEPSSSVPCHHHYHQNRVLVHCISGISRSVTLLASYLMRRTGVSAADALRWIKQCRPCANPNKGFVEQLRKLEDSRRVKNSIPPDP